MVATFKNIEGFENYSVSDHGNVRNDKTGRILKGRVGNGYIRVSWVLVWLWWPEYAMLGS